MLPFDEDEVRQRVELLCLKRHNVFYGICRLYFAVAVINIDQFISVVAHAQFFHICELAQTVAGLYALHKVMVFILF